MVSELTQAQGDQKRAEAEYAKYQQEYADRKAKGKEIKQQKKEALDRGDKATVNQLREEQVRNEQFQDSARSHANDALNCVETIRKQVEQQGKKLGK